MNDRIDARLIAATATQVDAVGAADALAQLKTCLEHVTLPELRQSYQDQIATLRAWKLGLLAAVLRRIRTRPDFRRYGLLRSLRASGRSWPQA